MDALTRAGYLAHATAPAHQRRIVEARQIMHQAAALGRIAVMISGGKDSLVMAHLARKTLGPLDGFFIDSGAEHPSALDTIATLREARYAIETVHPDLTIVEMLQQVGALGYDGPNRLPGAWHWTAGDFKRVLISEPAAAIRGRGYPVALLGLRADESRGRLLSMRRFGAIRGRRDGAIIACPLAWWSGDDVIAYALSHDLPLSDIYLRDDIGGDPRRRRTGTLLGDTSTRYGRWAELRTGYPEIWQRLVDMFPEMVRWA